MPDGFLMEVSVLDSCSISVMIDPCTETETHLADRLPSLEFRLIFIKFHPPPSSHRITLIYILIVLGDSSSHDGKRDLIRLGIYTTVN